MACSRPADQIQIFILLIDFATKLRAVHVVKSYGLTQMLSESSEDVIKAIAEKWLAEKPKPRLVVHDNSSVLTATDVNEFLTNWASNSACQLRRNHGLSDLLNQQARM